MKKILALMLSFVLVVALLPFCWGANAFSDVDQKTVEGSAIAKLCEAGIVNGFNDGLFHAERGLTRAQFCKMANKVFGFTEVGTETFRDVPENYWGAKEISIAQKAGYIQGVGNNNFGPERALTREQVCIMLVRIIKPEPIEFTSTITDKVSDWALNDVKTALAYYMFSLESGGKFRAQEAITRGEVSVVLARYLNSNTPIVKPDSEYVLALKNLSTAFSKMQMTSAEEKVLIPVKTLLEKVITVADNGTTEVTKEYVDKTYATELKNIKKNFTSMNVTASKAMKNKIALLTTAEAAAVLYDTFLVIESSGGGGGGGGSDGPSGDPAPTPDNSEEVQAVRIIKAQLENMKQNGKFNSHQQKVILPLIECMSNVLDDAEEGVKITSEYIKREYSGAIRKVQEEMDSLESIDDGFYYAQLKATLVNGLSDEKYVLLDWFNINI